MKCSCNTWCNEGKEVNKFTDFWTLLCCLQNFKRFCSPPPSISKATKIAKICLIMSKICPLEVKGINVWFKLIRIIWVLRFKLFVHCFIVSTLPKPFTLLQMAHPQLFESFKTNKSEEDIEFGNKGGLNLFPP